MLQGTVIIGQNAATLLQKNKISAEVIDVRVLNPLNTETIIKSVKKTRNLMVVDPGWLSAGFSAEITSKVLEQLPSNCLKNPPLRIALPDAPAPTSKN